MRTIFAALLLIFIVFDSYGQEIPKKELWTLDKCINYAWENNLQIQKQKLSIEQSSNDLKQSKLNYIPSLGASIGHNMSWGKSVDLKDLQVTTQFMQNTSANINTSIALLDGLSKINTVKSNKAAVNISIQEVESLKNDISINITKAYLQILLSKEILQTNKNNFNSISEQRNRTAILVDAGNQAYSSLLEIESQLASERVELVRSKNKLKADILALLQLLNLPYNSEFGIMEPTEIIDYSSLPKENIDSIFNIASALPKIKAKSLQLEQNKLQLLIAKGSAYPSIHFSAGYGTYYSNTGESSFFSQLEGNRNPSIGFSLNIPIFNNWRTNTQIRNARIGVKKSELDLKDTKYDLYKEIQSVLLDAESIFEQMLASKVNLHSIEESFKYVEEKFNVGALNSTDYTVSKTNLLKAQSEYYKAKYQFIFQLKIIDFYKGKPLTL